MTTPTLSLGRYTLYVFLGMGMHRYPDPYDAYESVDLMDGKRGARHARNAELSPCQISLCLVHLPLSSVRRRLTATDKCDFRMDPSRGACIT
jgi:hypothetical protein